MKKLTKKKKRTIATFSIIVIAVLLLGIFISNQNTLSIGIAGVEKQKLDFCSNEKDCIDFLKDQGMPENYLQENGIKISCKAGICYAER